LSKILITGGAGFIGSNAVERFCSLGHDVTVVDNLSRPGSNQNLQWLQDNHSFEFVEADLTDYGTLTALVSRFNPEVVIHCAGQVAVTTSIEDPRGDFGGNLLSTFNVLEALRHSASNALLIFTSTNKVYGQLSAVPTEELETRYRFATLSEGIDEKFPLDFQSPYGCSKGAADQYVLDYSRTYGLATVVFRQSCIYGPRQFGVEDQGWIAWFMIASLLSKPATVFGDGKQVRDALFVGDLLDAFEAAIANREVADGKAYNIGGGVGNTVSVLELVERIGNLSGQPFVTSFGPWRHSDQKVFISDIRAAYDDLGWEPKTSIGGGFEILWKWIRQNISTIEAQLRAR
jgi:CDP-paratose 2-epimerase